MSGRAIARDRENPSFSKQEADGGKPRGRKIRIDGIYCPMLSDFSSMRLGLPDEQAHFGALACQPATEHTYPATWVL